MLREIAIGDLLVSPYTAVIVGAGAASVLTRLVVPSRWWDAIALKRSWLNLSLFVCYVAGALALAHGQAS